MVLVISSTVLATSPAWLVCSCAPAAICSVLELISLEALASRAAQLRKVELVRPRSVIGKNTVEALQSGALYGFAGQVDGLVDRIVEELGDVTAVIATGGLAPIVVPESLTITHHDPDLTLVGLRLVFEKNAELA
jgi:type III pantothenate kinase